MRDWKSIMEEEAEKYGHLSEEEFAEVQHEAAATFLTEILPAIIRQGASLQELTDFLAGKIQEKASEKALSLEEILKNIDEALDTNNKEMFTYYAKLYKKAKA